MRLATGLAGCVVAVGVFTAPVRARAQRAPPLLPPPPGSGPPTVPTYSQPSPTPYRVDEGADADSGRGLDFVYFNVEGGLELVALDALHSSGSLLPSTKKHSSVGPAFGVGAGLQLLFWTAGPRFRFAHFGDWDLWTLNLELGWRIPLGKLEPYATVGGGYARLGHAADDVLGSDRAVGISGFDARLGGGVDYYVSNVLSVGGAFT